MTPNHAFRASVRLKLTARSITPTQGDAWAEPGKHLQDENFMTSCGAAQGGTSRRISVSPMSDCPKPVDALTFRGQLSGTGRRKPWESPHSNRCFLQGGSGNLMKYSWVAGQIGRNGRPMRRF